MLHILVLSFIYINVWSVNLRKVVKLEKQKYHLNVSWYYQCTPAKKLMCVLWFPPCKLLQAFVTGVETKTVGITSWNHVLRLTREHIGKSVAICDPKIFHMGSLFTYVLVCIHCKIEIFHDIIIEYITSIDCSQLVSLSCFSLSTSARPCPLSNSSTFYCHTYYAQRSQ